MKKIKFQKNQFFFNVEKEGTSFCNFISVKNVFVEMKQNRYLHKFIFK